MMPFDSSLVAVSAYVTAAFGLAGSLIGGAIAGTVSLLVARQAREAAERSWMRDSRREIYDRFLTNAQRLLIACEASESLGESLGTHDAEHDRQALEQAHLKLLRGLRGGTDRGGAACGRCLPRLCISAIGTSGNWPPRSRPEGRPSSTSELDPAKFERVAQLVRFARHDTIDAMRTELGLSGSAQPPKDFNPFRGTDLEDQYKARPAER
jgi:hypothetical protein